MEDSLEMDDSFPAAIVPDLSESSTIESKKDNEDSNQIFKPKAAIHRPKRLLHSVFDPTQVISLATSFLRHAELPDAVFADDASTRLQPFLHAANYQSLSRTLTPAN